MDVVCFPCVVTGYLISKGCILICCNCCFTKQWVWFSTYCHCSLSNDNRSCFPCVDIAHLISSGWISICCQCCFTIKWTWLPTCCQCHLSKSSGFGFPLLSLHTSCHLKNQRCSFSLCCYCIFSKHWEIFNIWCPCCFTSWCMWFSLFYHYCLSESNRFFLCYHHTFNKQWIFLPYVVTVVSLSSGSNFTHVFATLFEKAIHLDFFPLTLHI